MTWCQGQGRETDDPHRRGQQGSGQTDPAQSMTPFREKALGTFQKLSEPLYPNWKRGMRTTTFSGQTPPDQF